MITLFPRRCNITNKGMFSGFVFSDKNSTYIKDEKEALKFAQSNGFENLEESYNEEFHYYTEWDCEEESLIDEGSAYDENGVAYIFKNNKWIKDE